MQIRRVVTGQASDGRSVFVSDERIDPITIAMMPGSEFHPIWGGDGPPDLPTDGTPPATSGWFPPAGGYRFLFFTLAPDSVTAPEDLDPAKATAEMQQKLPGLLDLLEPDNPGMHASDTVDLIVIVSGEVDLELDDGAEVHLKVGDTVIQNGTRHAWRNRSSQPCLMLAANVGASRRS